MTVITETVGDRILEELRANIGETVTLPDLYERVYGHRFLARTSNALQVHIVGLRRRGEQIVTVRGIGYKLVA